MQLEGSLGTHGHEATHKQVGREIERVDGNLMSVTDVPISYSEM